MSDERTIDMSIITGVNVQATPSVQERKAKRVSNLKKRMLTQNYTKDLNYDEAPGISLLTDQQELYCRYRAEGHSKSQAYRLAFPNNNHPGPSAANLEKLPHIQHRVNMFRKERANAARLVDPNESLTRWNEIYLQAMGEGNFKVAMEAQKQIDKINGADQGALAVKDKNDLFRGEESEWKDTASKLLNMLNGVETKQ